MCKQSILLLNLCKYVRIIGSVGVIYYKIASVLHRISLDERHFPSEYRERFDVFFILCLSSEPHADGTRHKPVILL